MGVNPHDLLKIGSVKDLMCYSPIPDWVTASISKAPFVVVRRARAPEGFISVGIRGSRRSERFAAFLPTEKLIEQITPEQLVNERRWIGNPKEIFCWLGIVSQILENYPFKWGLAGSTGFELASGIETTTSNSDIDIIMRKSSRLTVSIAKSLKKELETIPVRVDVQVESNEGAFSLSEYVMSVGKDLLLRTQDGPILIRKCLLQRELES